MENLCGNLFLTNPWRFFFFFFDKEFSVPQIEYPLRGSRQKGNHVYFLLIVAMVLVL